MLCKWGESPSNYSKFVKTYPFSLIPHAWPAFLKYFLESPLLKREDGLSSKFLKTIKD